MAATTITDLVVPEIWGPYTQENLPLHSTLQSAGAVEINDSPDVIGGDEYTREPKFEPLDSTGDAENIVPNTNVTLESTDAYAEYGVIARRAKGWSQEDLAKIATGTDPLGSALTQHTEYWARQIEKDLHAVTKAAFGSGGDLESTHQVDQAGNALTTTMINDGKFLLGEAFNAFDLMTCHSVHFQRLVEMGMIDYVDASTFGERVLLTGSVPTFLGMQVSINNIMCAAWSGSTYPVYLSGGQPWRISYQRPVTTEKDRNIVLAAGTDQVVSSVHFAPHIKGISYSSSGTPTATKRPTRDQLATVGSWERVATNADQIRLVQILAD